MILVIVVLQFFLLSICRRTRGVALVLFTDPPTAGFARLALLAPRRGGARRRENRRRAPRAVLDARDGRAIPRRRSAAAVPEE